MAGYPSAVEAPPFFDALVDDLGRRGAAEAIVEHGIPYTYRDLDERVRAWRQALPAAGVSPGMVVGLQSDFSLDALALILALFANRNIVALVPMSAPETQQAGNLHDAQAQIVFGRSQDGALTSSRVSGVPSTHPLLRGLWEQDRAGFVIFTSGSTGSPKAVLHDLERFLSKFRAARKAHRSLAFLLLEHIAGLDTLFYTLFSGGSLVLPERRDPGYICASIASHGVEVLAVTPSFLNLLCLSGEYSRHDLSSLKVVAYSSEPMNPTTLERVVRVFPHVEIMQKYGTSEFGSPRSRSARGNTLWLKLGGDDDFQYKVVDDVLWVKAASTMLGYLNAPAPPVDAEGWMSTGDAVQVDGEWIRVLGRKSETIIVGGEKVFPSEVESVIVELDAVEDVAVSGKPHPIMGHVVTARVKLRDGVTFTPSALAAAIRRHCRGRLQPFKIPVKVSISDTTLTGARQKKMRS